MRHSKVVEFQINNNSTLRINKDKIMATVYDNKQNKVEIFLTGQEEPFVIYDTSEKILDRIWED